MELDALFDVMREFAKQVIGGTGVSQVSSPSGETYVFRTAELEIVGVLRVLSSGVFVIAVRSDSRRQGIATALLDAAANAIAEGSASFKPDFSKTTYSQDGQAFVDAYRGQIKENQKMNPILETAKPLTDWLRTESGLRYRWVTLDRDVITSLRDRIQRRRENT